ncbi:MAG: 1-(5-phosphoribosyl)-5-[(5-phosphoribosylamino)methylideneamino] imidazole-4-carboxamide isomerase [Candidatus Moanabacter tarae]|uniref:1-(5-phosphoribosyl)-5-[(5-phosphoribosylamino)methylideneamino] imidazole-4-carboxamide isomerase n=1 Tax=Candidatus Moanibacter tarae TaxID=2200854 RepID=A0A2Z4AEF4_9BACT|nr:MAG: 1-(5-phosphoribosyl)-5-[(5-phosphoribosylamino)methylideneamino] imidazole-4-carboxamide isomerase [Candidatus Moanabacter tarae]|tara:strand:+ start:9001 stop:9729 length:729 start_codon:yes stop_codon:yes gene_type:complete
MIIYPSIDLREGRVVRLLQGRKEAETVYFDNPLEPAERWKEAGAEWIHVVDLDGAFTGKPKNWEAIGSIVTTGLKVELGGGLRSEEDIERAFNCGVSRVVLGTKAVSEADWLSKLAAQHGNRLAVGIDARGGKVAVEGWAKTTEVAAQDLALAADASGIQYIIYTDIARDGMLTGPNFSAQRKMVSEVSARVIASGGVSKISDIPQFLQIKEKFKNFDGIIIGKALYENRFNLSEAIKLASA